MPLGQVDMLSPIATDLISTFCIMFFAQASNGIWI